MKNIFCKKFLSVFLCVATLFTCMPITALMASAAQIEADSFYNRVVDANTMDGWKEYFPLKTIEDDPLTQENEYDPLSTENAGGVWTDKSVFTNADAFSDGVEMIDDEKNFLTVLSSIAANKEVVGYSTVPTDTVFVLDVSNSMSADSVTRLVSATNQAIKDLQKMNNNNRVGVVLYSGDGNNRTYDKAVARVMPIDRYTTSDQDGNFIEYVNKTIRLVTENNTVQVSGLNGAVVSESKSHGGATYMQAGLWEAWEMFNEVDDADIIIDKNNWQKGEARMPIVVLMTDGKPTLAASDFSDIKNQTYGSQNTAGANVGDGVDSHVQPGQGFLVQLTASYVKNRIDDKYKVHEEGYAGRSLFFTLGFNLTSSGNVNEIATNVLNPDGSDVTDSLWATYNDADTTTMSVEVTGRESERTSVTVTKNPYATSKSYVDEYFSASGDDELSDAFENIVGEILIQSRYYPTHLEGGNPNFSGYVEFTDTLGEYMQVKHINGILLGDTLFDGHMMASKLADNSQDGLGTPENPTVLGNEFIWSVQNRLGISNVEDARNLVSAAYSAKQLYYADDTNWSNYIGWYADSEEKFIGHWNETPTQSVPDNAVYKIKSYGFLGKTTGSIKDSDMMYMSVQIKTDIVTGMQTVYWKIPASLIPMLTYLVELDGNSVDTATNIRISVEDVTVSPIRLIYETGLRSDLNEFNITLIEDQEHIAADGYTRIFWNNYFANLDAQSHNEHITTMSEFTPNKENERFYYTFDSAVHKKVGDDYEIVTESEGLDPENKSYYHRRYIFSDDNFASAIFFYEKMSEQSVQAALDNGFDDDFESLEHQTIGAWVVPKGTPARELDMYDMPKSENPTNSAKMVFHPYMTTHNNMVAVDMNLGNNGLLSVIPATGLKVSKTVDVSGVGDLDTFKFRITASESGTFDSWITDIDATPSGQATQVTLTNGVYEFELKKDQTFWLLGLSADTAYTVEEISDVDNYKVKSVHVNSVLAGQYATGTVTAHLIDDIDFVNTILDEGDLIITKQVVDQNGDIIDVNDDIKFTINVTLIDAFGEFISGSFETSNGPLTISGNGTFSVNLSDGESFVIYGIREETVYTATETEIENFTLNAQESVLEGVIDCTVDNQVLVVNTYKATPNEIVIDGTKTLNGRELIAKEFSFELYDESGLKLETVKNEADGTFAFSAIPVEEEGDYVYTVKEIKGDAEGITYDSAIYTVTATVTDNLDGTFKVEYTYAKGTQTADGITFTNIYTQQPTPKPEPESPQTGESTNLMMWFVVLFVSGTGVFGLSRNERRRKMTNK